MVAPRMRLHGAAELEKALREMPKRTGKAVLRRALTKAAQPIADDARAGAERIKPTMGVAIRVAGQLSRRQRRARAKAGTAEVFVGATPGPLAHLFEFGTGPRRHKSGKSTGQMRAFPFLRPAWEEGKAQALREFSRLLWIEIEKTAKRLARKTAR